MSEVNPGKFDLAERTDRFSKSVIDLCKSLPRDVVAPPLMSQLVRAATSIGANYCEADEAVWKKEFRCKIGICRACN
ncbi:MAG TPA: four helix bundle protein [Gemmataceae bacterium]|jgi:four helix bundle protein|nr:four helix bundle protein [Gemmataceae bacterium]